MHRQKGPHAVACAMVKILSRLPQSLTRQGIKVTPCQPARPARTADGDDPLQHASVTGPRLLARIAYGHGAGDVGRALAVLGAGINQQQLVLVDGAVAFVGDTVVHNGPVGPRPADRVKRDVMQSIGGTAEPFQRLHHGDFGEALFGGLRIQPGQKLYHRGAIAQMCFAHAGNFASVLAGLGQTARIIAPHHLADQI